MPHIRTARDDQMDDAYRAGRKAFRDDLSANDNPYDDKLLRKVWRDGYESAVSDARYS